jgi:nicotinamide mononucleotide transporter
MSKLEIVACGFGLASVWLTVRQDILCWPTGLVQVLLYIVVFYQARLYSEVGLHGVYVVLQVYGWHAWLHGGKGHGELAVSRIARPAALLWAGVAGLGTAALGFTMARATDAALPLPDAAVTVWSLIAQYLMARKVLESWLVWIAVDVLAIGVYLVKALYPTTVLYAVFLLLATRGFFAWRQTLSAPEAG